MVILQILMGFCLGILASSCPAMKTFCWLISYSLGKEYSLLTLWLAEALYQIAPQLVGGFDSYGQSIGTDYKSNVSLHLIRELVKAKAIHLMLGILIGTIYSYLGFKGFGTTFTWFALALVVFCKYGFNGKVWLTLSLMSIGILFFSLVGVVNTPIVFISIFTTNALSSKDNEEQADPMEDLFGWVYDPLTIFAGAIGGIAPGLNADVVCKNAVAGWMAGATAEGVSLAILLLQRNTSKSTLTMFLSQLSQPGLDPYLTVILIIIVTWLIYEIPVLAIKQYFPPEWISFTLSISATSYFLSIPDQPLLTLILSAFIHLSFKCFKQIIGKFPAGFTKTLASAPILFL